MPLELDFDNLEKASNYIHTYALSQGFDIRIQWSANNQTRICWSCYRGGFPETLNADGTPNTKKRQIPKEKERRKRGSLKIGCPFRVQCTKNWKTGKMELRILEGRHKHQMETDRGNLPSQVRRIKSERKAHDSPGTPQTGNAAANAVAQAANLTSTPTPVPSGSGSSLQTGAKGRASAASKNGTANRNGTANAQQRNQSQQQQQAQQQQPTDQTSSANANLLVNAAAPSAHQQLSLLGTPTPSNGAGPSFDLDLDDVLTASASPAPQIDFQRQMLQLLGLYDRSDAASRAIMDRELVAMFEGAQARLGDKTGRKKRKMGPNGTVLDPASSGMAAFGTGTPAIPSQSNGSIAALASSWLDLLIISYLYPGIQFVLPVIADSAKVEAKRSEDSSTTTARKTPKKNAMSANTRIVTPSSASSTAASNEIPIVGYAALGLTRALRFVGGLPPCASQLSSSVVEKDLETTLRKADTPLALFPEVVTSNNRALLAFNILPQNPPPSISSIHILTLKYTLPSSTSTSSVYAVPGPTNSLTTHLLHILFLSNPVRGVSIRHSTLSSKDEGEGGWAEKVAGLMSSMARLKRTSIGWEAKREFLQMVVARGKRV
uniref:FAR1 domain-containing protein n=1 Tax=Kalmanozyma brasiliensis (strain GHG001) TaxID=1365824 RepID=V5GLR8_KALBG